MVSSGTVTSHLGEVSTSFNSLKSAVESIHSSWQGASYDNLSSKVEAMSSEYLGVVSQQMETFAGAINDYNAYLNAKSNMASAKSRGDTSSESSYASEMSQLKQKIESALSSISKTLEGAPANSSVSSTAVSGDITYQSGRFADTTVWWSVIPKDKMPQLAMAHDNYDKAGSERPTDMARRKNATLGINFALTGSGAGMIYANGKLVRGNDGNGGEVLFMTQDGKLESVSNKKYSERQVINNFNPVWATTGFYAIARDGHYVDWNTDLAKARHPRTFIGQDNSGNYIVGVCTGRRDGEKGMTLRQVYDFVTTNVTSDLRFLYNADGGGSSAFVYKGEKLNPNTDKSERLRPDLIYWT